MAAWIVYYADGSTFSSDDGDVTEAPALGVIDIVQPDEKTGRKHTHADHYYWWDDGAWYGGDMVGFWDYLQRPGWKRVLFGQQMSRVDYDALMFRARREHG